jgi:GntR family transcriptional regulator / MocR family aminotransferase
VAELARTLQPGARVAVEEPGYQRAVDALRDAGLTVLAAPVDEAGLVVDALPPGLTAVYSTPAHQYPLGARLSAARRVALVERARVDGFLVVEDDYDGELRYDVAPLPLLAALGPDVVAHLGTASKLLTPTLGVGWLVAPPSVHAAVLELRARTGARPARAGQRVFAALAAHGDLARHLRRLRRELAARRAAVLDAVTGAGAAVQGDAAGAHVVVPLPDAATERAVRAAAAARGVALDGLARHHSGPAERTGLVLGYAGPRRADLQRALVVVADVLQNHATGAA